MQVEVLKSSIQESEETSLKKRQLPDEFSALGLGAFEKVRVGVGTCACVIHMGNVQFNWPTVHYFRHFPSNLPSTVFMLVFIQAFHIRLSTCKSMHIESKY